MKDGELVGLLEKHNLPGLEELRKNFNLSELNDSENPLKHIVKRMGNKADYFSGILESVIQPDSGFSAMHEHDSFSEDLSNEMLQAYRDLMYYHRYHLQVMLDYSDIEAAIFIKEFWSEWTNLKRAIYSALETMKRSWKINSDMIKMELNYLG